MAVRITRATEERLPALCALLGRAFVNEPMLGWSLGPGDDLEERLTRQFELFNESLVGQGMIWEAGDAQGAAVWIPADSADAYGRAFEASSERVRELTEDGGRRYDEFWAWVESRIPAEPLWHLDAIGVARESRGSGIGAALVEHGLQRAAADGRAVWLETGTAGNVPYYERFGFRLVDDPVAPGGGPQIWFMRWDPD